MPHPEFWPLIDAYADGSLPGEEAERLEEHLRSCEDDCPGRLAGARREALALRTAMAPPEPPADLARSVLARVGEREMRTTRVLRPGVYAGIAANLITAALLLLLSIGSSASFPSMVVVALLGALIWGGIKGAAYAALVRRLPLSIPLQGLLFGLGVWAVTNALLVLTGGVDNGYTTSFVLVGSLIHHLIYGLLISVLFWRLTSARPRPPALRRSGGAYTAPCLLAIVALLATPNGAGRHEAGSLGHRQPTSAVSLAAGGAAMSVSTASPTSTPDLLSPTPTSSPVSPTATSTAGPTPTASTPVTTPTPTTTSTPVVTAAPVSVTPVASPAAPPRRRAVRHHTPSTRDQLRSILPAVVAPAAHRTPIQRARDVLQLLNFL